MVIGDEILQNSPSTVKDISVYKYIQFLENEIIELKTKNKQLEQQINNFWINVGLLVASASSLNTIMGHYIELGEAIGETDATNAAFVQYDKAMTMFKEIVPLVPEK